MPGRRIPLHDHADGNSGGKLAAHATATGAAAAMASSGSGGSSTGVDLRDDGASVFNPATVLNARIGLVADASGNLDAVDTPVSHGSMGSTETFDASAGAYHYGTLNANCTVTFTGATAGTLARLILELLEDGTGGWSPTWPGSVVWVNGVTPTHDTTAGSTTIYSFASRDGGTTWFGAAGGGQLTVKDEGTPLATAASSLDFVGAGVTASGTGAAKTITIPGGATASDTGIWRPLLDAGTGAIITDATTGEAIMSFGPA